MSTLLQGSGFIVVRTKALDFAVLISTSVRVFFDVRVWSELSKIFLLTLIENVLASVCLSAHRRIEPLGDFAEQLIPILENAARSTTTRHGFIWNLLSNSSSVSAVCNFRVLAFDT